MLHELSQPYALRTALNFVNTRGKTATISFEREDDGLVEVVGVDLLTRVENT
jgi:hypothetical protein